MSDNRNISATDPSGSPGAAAAQAELREARQELTALRGLMEAMCENMTDGIALFDADRRIVHVNKAAQDFLGIGPVPIGLRGEDILRAREAVGDSAVVDGKELSIEERMALIFAPQGSRFERRLAGGRRGEILFRPLRDGRTLCVCRDITDLKQRQIELKQVRDSLADANRLTTVILESMTDGVALFDADRRLAYFNPAVDEHMSLPGAPPLRVGMTMQEIAHGRIAAGERVEENGAALSVEERIARVVDPRGCRYTRLLTTGRYIEFIFRPVGDGRTLGFYRDITDLKLRQEELKQARDESRKSRELMEAVLGSMKDGVALFGEGRVQYANPALAGLFDFAGAFEPRGMAVVDVLRMLEAAGDHIEDDGKALSPGDRARRIFDAQPAVYTRVLPSGRHVEYRFERLADGRTVGHYRDITAHQNRQSALELAHARLAASERRLSEVLDNLPDGIMLFNSDQRLLYTNKAFNELFGIPAGNSIVGSKLVDLLRLQHDIGDRPRVDGKVLTVEQRLARILSQKGERVERVLPSGRTMERFYCDLSDGKMLGVFHDVTELKRRQAALEHAHGQLAEERGLMASVLDGMPAGVGLLDGQTVLYANKMMAELFGYTGLAIRRGITLPEIVRAQEAAGDRAFVDGRPLSVEARVARVQAPGGSRFERELPTGRHVEFQFMPMGDGRTLGIYRDITDEKRRQAELAKAQDDVAATRTLMSDILKGLPIGITVFDAERYIIYANRKVSPKALGLADDALPSRVRLDDIIRAQMAVGDHLYADDGTPLTLEQRLALSTDPRGSRSDRLLPSGRHVEFSFRPVGGGNTMVIVRDITDLKRRQAEVEAARDQVAAAHRLTVTILETMTDGISLFHADGTIAFVNHTVREEMRIPEDALPNLTLQQIVRRQVEAGDDVVVDGRILSVEERIARILDPAGCQFERMLPWGKHIEFIFRPVGDGRTLGIYRDITDLKRRQIELEAARDAAEAANQAKSTFLATISHEIRTPMNGVIGTAELLEREPLDDRQKRLVRTVRTSAAALLRIIDDVLDFSKIEAGRMELEEAPFQLRAVVEGTAETLSVQAERKGLSIATALEPGTPDRLRGDATRLRQILFNLIGNAIKFTDVGEIRVHVRALSDSSERVRLALSVADTGIGVSAEQAARLFQPFSQADSSTTRRFGGTGLGLSIVRRLAELMGGGVSVESAPSKGSTFTVTLDLARADGPSEKAAPVAVASGRIAGGRVLAIDDYPINLEVLTGQLDILGVAVDTATDGIDALTKWRKRPYALVLTDIHMPDMDGFELTRQIRAEEALAGTGHRTPIVALTANALKGESEKCLAAGMDGYLTKPLTLDRLREAVERWMGTPAGAPASGAAGPSDPPIDRTVVAQMFGDSPATIDRILTRFRAAGANLMAEIAAADGDVRALAEIAHKLKGAARAAGAVRLGDLAAALEQSGSAADAAALQAEWQRVAQALPAST